jgi:hypothetical protein
MNDQEIAQLRAAVKAGHVVWAFDPTEAPKLVRRVGNPPKPEDGDEPEPSACAYMVAGGYVALYNADLAQFSVMKSLADDARQAADAARWQDGVENEFPKCGRQIHPSVGEPFYYVGDLTDGPNRFGTPEAAIDWVIAERIALKNAPVSEAPGQNKTPGCDIPS